MNIPKLNGSPDIEAITDMILSRVKAGVSKKELENYIKDVIESCVEQISK